MFKCLRQNNGRPRKVLGNDFLKLMNKLKFYDKEIKCNNSDYNYIELIILIQIILMHFKNLNRNDWRRRSSKVFLIFDI